MKAYYREVVTREFDVGRTEGRWAAMRGQDVGRMCDGAIIQPDRPLCQEGRRVEGGGGRLEIGRWKGEGGGRRTKSGWPVEHFSCSLRSLTEANEVKACGERRETTLFERRSWFDWF